MYIGDDIFKIVGDLSGGEKSRITLLELMLSDSNFLLMDEPTNHLDIDSKEVLEEALNSYEATAFIISHDRYFLNKVCDKLIEIKDQKVKIYNGNYDYYLTKQDSYILKQNELNENKTKKRKDAKKEREEQKLIRQYKTRIKNIEFRLEEIDLEIENLNTEFTKPEVFEDFDKTRAISLDIENLNNEKDNISLEWMEIIETLDDLENPEDRE